MGKQKEKKAIWGTTLGEFVQQQFVKRPINMVSLVCMALLALMAVIAPVLANNKPLMIRIEGKLHFPLFQNLSPADYCIFLAATVGFLLLLLIRRNHSNLEPSVRGAVLFRQLCLSCTIILIGSPLIFIFVPRRLEAADYKAMIAENKADYAVFAPIPYGYDRTDLMSRNLSPCRTHWLGTDDVGADVLCRLIHGSRTSLSVGLVAAGISTLIGIALGSIFGYFGGKVDFIGMRIVEMVMAIPTFFLIITFVAFFPRSLLSIIVIIGITTWTGTARLVRAEFLKLRKQDFIQAAVSLALPLRSTIFKHMLPNCIGPILVNAAFGFAGAIFAEAALSFLGFGVAPPTPSWGQMLSSGVTTTGRFLWWLTLFPGLAIFLTVMLCNLIGEGLRDAFDPRLKNAI